VLSVSLPPELAQEYDRLARERHKNRSELFREMLEIYRREQLLSRLRSLQSYGSASARRRSILTEKDAERLVFRGR
jgi:metal-responsive CopG/Arc/MetJ family transcriptional regulator